MVHRAEPGPKLYTFQTHKTDRNCEGLAFKPPVSTGILEGISENTVGPRTQCEVQ